jgi:hypothetical protein
MSRHPFAEEALKMPLQPPPEPWPLHRIHTIGGLIEVGYGRDTDYLLVISWQGRVVFDCRTGQKIARDEDMEGYYDKVWYDPVHLSALGIGALEGQIVQLAGLNGGGLNTITEDGWMIAKVSPNWPHSSIILRPPHVFSRDGENYYAGCFKVAPHSSEDDIRAYGFSQTGKSFIVAMSHTIEIFSRP